MHPSEFSTTEQSNQVSEQMQFAVFESHGQAAQSGLYALTVLIIVMIAWSALADSDICAEAKGQLEPKERVQFIRPTTDGTVVEYQVKDGQPVKAGDILVVLNVVRAEAELNKKEQEQAVFENQLRDHEKTKTGLAQVIANPQHIAKDYFPLPEASRVAGELFAAKTALDASVYDMSKESYRNGVKMLPEMAVLQSQKQRLEAVRQARTQSVERKQTEREAERQKLESRVTLLEATLEKSRTQLSELEAGLSDAKKEMEIYERGKQLGVASEVKFLEVQNYMHERVFSVAQQKLQIAELEQELKSARVDFESVEPSYNAELAELGAGVKAEDIRISSVPLSMSDTIRMLQHRQAAYDVASYHARALYSQELSEINNLKNKISECQAAMIMLKAQLAEKSIQSPIDGTVSGITQLRTGQIVLRGQTLMTIVPSNNELVLRAEINNIDVGFVETGQDARLRIDAFPCEIFGIIHGKVVRVGAYPEEKLEGQKKVSVYRATIKPDQSFIQSAGKRFELKPGLQVHADIVLRKRSYLALLFEPLLKMGNY